MQTEPLFTDLSKLTPQQWDNFIANTTRLTPLVQAAWADLAQRLDKLDDNVLQDARDYEMFMFHLKMARTIQGSAIMPDLSQILGHLEAAQDKMALFEAVVSNHH